MTTATIISSFKISNEFIDSLNKREHLLQNQFLCLSLSEFIGLETEMQKVLKLNNNQK